MKNILITTGGSGGHVIPALNLFDHLKNLHNILLVTDERGKKFIDNDKYDYHLLNIPQKKSLLFIPITMIQFFVSIIKSFFYLKKIKADVLISTGGYMSLPFCISAKIIGIDIYLFEPNMVIGRANKFFLRFCKKIMCYNDKIINFPEKQKKKIYLINPILNKNIYNFKRNNNLDQSKTINLLVLGGSQGAKFFDKFVVDLVLKLSNFANISVYQQVYEPQKIEKINKIYLKANIKNEIFSYDPDIYKKMLNCNLAITRCGASTLAELTQLNLPFIGIPFPFAKDNHQYYNGKNMLSKNCCWLLDQKNIQMNKVIDLLQKILSDDKEYNDKILNMNNISCKNSWNDINKKLTILFNEY